jgi:hypothetical protein
MTDFFADDFFTELDLVGDPLDAAEVPVVVPGAETVAGPDWYSDVWFSELDPGAPDAGGGAATDLPLPDPFQSGTGAGAAGLLGSRFARNRGGAQSSPAQSGGAVAKAAPSAQAIAAVVQIADTSASLVQRLAGMRRKGRSSDS